MLGLVAVPGAGQDRSDAAPAGEIVRETPGDAPQPDGPAYPVRRIVVQYLRDHPDHPPAETLRALKVNLGKLDSGYVAPRPGVPTETVTLSDEPDQPRMFHASALQRILESLRDELTRRELMGVFVAPDPFEIDETGIDVRPAGEADLHLIVTTGTVAELRTLASGERLDPERRVNHPKHERLRAHSPVHPEPGKRQTDLLRKDLLDDWVFHLSRHPGRRVDVALSPGVDPGTVSLDYLVTENKAWTVFAQTSNTGTEQTNEWRQRFGFFHNQLTNRDDIFAVDYLTAGFENTHAVLASYEARVGDAEKLRWKIFGGWNEFTASDVGFGKDTFSGDSWNIGAELAWNFYQDRNLFLDLFAGARYEDIAVENTIPGSSPGDEEFLLPRIGVRLDRDAEWYNSFGQVFLEFQSGGVTNVDPDDIDELGRPGADDDWLTLQWDLSHSFYIEPVLDRQAWDQVRTDATLAHELYVGFRGQWAFDDRLPPQFQQVAGGGFTVRGYDESATAGDTLLLFTAEYRYHIPRSFGVEPEPGRVFGAPFRWAPQYTYGTPDWDLVFRAFIDAARVINTDASRFQENNDTLVGTGVGLELSIRRNVSLRVDWGVALRPTEDGRTDRGDNRFHFVFTILY